MHSGVYYLVGVVVGVILAVFILSDSEKEKAGA